MKNVAILVVQYDKVSKLYEVDMTYLNNHDKVNKELYISSSPNVTTELVKFAIGSQEIKELEKLETVYRNKNNEK